jgi:hypothetical protein
VYLFAKNDRGNIDRQDLADLKDYAKILFEMTDQEIERTVEAGALEVMT